MTYIAQLEPEALLDAFVAHPPVGFLVERSISGMPTFVTQFDLLTTADDALRSRVTHLPGYRHWGRWLRWRTRFFGCTVTEYAPLPCGPSAADLADSLLGRFRNDCALLVVKDLAYASPLLSKRSNAYTDDFARECEARGCVLVEGMALAWVPIDFDTIDDYLGRLSHSRRKSIRRKLRSRQSLQIDCVRTGAPCFDDENLRARYYALYRNVYEQSEIHFDLLSEAFFSAVLRDGTSGGCVFTYRQAGALIGWNLCYEHDGMLVDKYVGFAYPAAREANLYVVSWMENLEYARRRGLSHYVAGWTDREVKRDLGARFCTTRHAVYVRNPLLRCIFRRMAHSFEGAPLQAASLAEVA